MSKFILAFDTDNAAFVDGVMGRDDEIARILRNVAERVQCGEDRGGIRDVNGNAVGGFAVEHDE